MPSRLHLEIADAQAELSDLVDCPGAFDRLVMHLSVITKADAA